MKYFKLIHGFDSENYIQIDETELEKAYYCFLEKKDSVYSGGAIRGNRIDEIKPDFHRIMGWNRGYKLQSEDYEDLAGKGIDRECQKLLTKTKEKIEYLIQTKQEHLIGKNVELPQLNPTNNPVVESIKSLSNKFKI